MGELHRPRLDGAILPDGILDTTTFAAWISPHTEGGRAPAVRLTIFQPGLAWGLRRLLTPRPYTLPSSSRLMEEHGMGRAASGPLPTGRAKRYADRSGRQS